jgi:hypothetical protein
MDGTDGPAAGRAGDPSVDGSDVLAGLDPAGPPPVLDGSAPFPTDTVVALGATVVGMGLGLLAGGRHPLVRAQVGALLGLAGAIVARRMWRLPG